MGELDRDEEWPVAGDNPGGPELLFGPARDHFNRRAERLGTRLRDDHEVATIIDSQRVAVDGLRLRARDKTKEYGARFIKGVSEHKKETAAATLTIAALLLAAQRLYIRRKNKNT